MQDGRTLEGLRVRDDRKMSYENPLPQPNGASDAEVTGRIQAVIVPPGSGHPEKPSPRSPTSHRAPVRPAFRIQPNSRPLYAWLGTLACTIGGLVLGFLLGMGMERGTWDDPPPASGVGQRVDECPVPDTFDPGADVDVDGDDRGGPDGCSGGPPR